MKSKHDHVLFKLDEKKLGEGRYRYILACKHCTAPPIVSHVEKWHETGRTS